MAPFSLFFDLLGQEKAAWLSKSIYPSGGSQQLDCKLQFLAATSTRAEVQSRFVQGTMAEHTEAL